MKPFDVTTIPISTLLAVFAGFFALTSPAQSRAPAQSSQSTISPAFVSCPTEPNMDSRQGKNVPFLADLGDFECDDTNQCKPYAEIRGTVFDEEGRPASGIRVQIYPKASKGKFGIATDKNGKYSYAGLMGGEYLVCVVYKGAAGLPRQVPLRIGRVTQSDFDLKYFEAGALPQAADGQPDSAPKTPPTNQ